MKSHGLLFSAPMALANVQGRKTETRRIIPFDPIDGDGQAADPERAWLDRSCEEPDLGGCACLKLPYGPDGGDLSTVQRFFTRWQAGDRIYQKETFFDCRPHKHTTTFQYADDFLYRSDCDFPSEEETLIRPHRWTPSIFMSREASRFTAEITQVRVQRLHQITNEDAIAEGITHVGYSKLARLKIYSVNPKADPGRHYEDDSETYDIPRMCYSDLWNRINLKPSPVYGPKDKTTGKRPILHYVSYPWSLEDFHKSYPSHSEWRNKPLHIFPNPWLFAISYRPI